MVAISSPAILRLAAGATTAYYSIERATRLLIAVDRWPHRGRRQLRAGDLGSILNAIMGSITDAIGSDNVLRSLHYKGTIPPTAEQEPALGTGNWGEVLDRLIENAPSPEPYPSAPATKNSDFRGVLPHTIETCLNPPSLLLVWLGPDGATRQRIDIYAPSGADDTQLREPYGPARWLIRKSFMNSNMIVLAGQILRDSSQRTTPRNDTAATPGRVAAARKPGPQKTPGSRNNPETSRARERAQRVSDPGPSSPFTPEKTNDRRSHSIARRDAHPA